MCVSPAAAASQIRLSVVVGFFFPGRSGGRHFKELQHLFVRDWIKTTDK